MPSNELETIAASIQDALHRAYEMGRSDALRRVVQMVQQDELGSKTVALLGHSEPPADAPSPDRQIEAQPIPLPHEEAKADGAEAAAPGDAPRSDGANAPWWEDRPRDTRPREERAPEERTSAPPASIGGFLKDFLYPLGGKK